MISYNYRDLFYDPDAHKDILIVPQKTQVIPKAGRTPLIKVYNPNTQTYVDQGTQVGDHKLTLNFIITNRNIYKEKFELTESINSADDLAFGSCEPQQVRFTIRNEKYKDENGEICDVVPPLTGAELIEGSVEMSSYQEIIKVYLYFNGDSSTLFYVGMYIVEEDKASKDGKTRDITAYDYLYQLRDMDISNWYKHLFGKGITTKTTDATESGYYYDGDFYEDSEHTELIEEPDDDTVYLDLSTDKEYYCDWNEERTSYTFYELSEDTQLEGEVVIRPGRPDNSEGGKEYWTIYELLYDLFQNLIVLKNDDSYYTGYGAQLWFDESIFNDNSKWYNLNKFKIKQNKNFIDNGSLSLGKLLEDIGIILGAYPKIMRGVPNSNGWCDALGESKDIVTPIPNASSSAVVNYTTHLTDYCVLTFIRLDKSTNIINKAQIVKEYKMLSGMSAEIYDVASVNLMRLYNSDGKVITSYSGGIVNEDLIKAYNTGKYKKIRAAYESGTNPDGTKKEGFVSITTYDVIDNIFFNQYGVKFKKKNSDGSTDTEEISIKENEKKLQTVLKRMFNAVNSRIYKPYEMQCIADLCRETGDRIRIINKFDEFNPLDFKTYILERKLSGIQKMIDTYSAKGSNGLPNFGNYKSGSSYAQSGMGGNKVSMSGGSGGFSAESSDSEGNVEDNTIDMTTYCELARNWGMRFLDEPNVTTCTYNKKKKKVVMKWEDPDDLDDNKPIPCTWVGTVVVRKENSAPLNPYDGDIIVNSTTRDEYKTTAFQDRTAKKGKEYYYAFMPYYLYDDSDPNNPIYVYRFTKTIKIDTGELNTSPIIEGVSPSATSVDVTYTLPSGCESAKIVAKKGSEPEDEEDGVVEDISVDATTGTITVANLDTDSEYVFKIFVDASESNAEECTTGRLSYLFKPDFTVQDIHDTVRYDPSNNCSYIYSGNPGDAGEGCIIEEESGLYTVNDGVLAITEPNYWGHYDLFWAFDPNHMQNIIPINSDVTISTSVNVDTDDSLMGVLAWLDIFITDSDPYDNLQDYFSANFLSVNQYSSETDYSSIVFRGKEDDPSAYDQFYEDFDIPKIERHVWYNVKFILHSLNGKFTSVELYINNSLIGIKTVPEGEGNIPMFNMVGNDLPSLNIVLGSHSEVLLKNVSISYLGEINEWTYDYTGSIQEFTAPKTGRYKLEVWGAQGGDATSGNTTARGGYGSYSVGEVSLTQGDKLYIDIGGQNGYNGGGSSS